MTKYKPRKKTKYITYLDANNLDGWAMSKPLPTHGFKWMNDEELKDWEQIPCCLEVDLDYPRDLHDLHNDYPLAPEPLKVNKVYKLIPNLYNKTKYVIHHENLKQYIKLGLRLKKIHRSIRFEESEWLKPYIYLNTNLGAKASNNFEKDFFKLMNNSIYGKTMENIRNRVDIHLVTNKRDSKKFVSKPNYNHRNIFSDNLIAIHMKKTKLVFNKPVYLGMCILDLSKTLMIFIIIILKRSMVVEPSYYLQILIASVMRLRLKIFMLILSLMSWVSLILQTILKITLHQYQSV